MQYPPERRQHAGTIRPDWGLWILLQMLRLWLAIVGGVFVVGMLYTGYCFVWVVWNYG